MRYSIDKNIENMLKDMVFVPFTRKLGDNQGQKTNGYCNKENNRCCKNCF